MQKTDLEVLEFSVLDNTKYTIVDLVALVMSDDVVEQAWAHDRYLVAAAEFCAQLDKRGYKIVKKDDSDAED